MNHSIWNNDVCQMAEDLQGQEEYLRMGSDELFDCAHEEIEANLESTIDNLDVEAPGEGIILVGTLVRWNGSFDVHKCLSTKNIGEAIREAISCFGSGDNTFEVYTEDGKLKISQLGHDNPCNPSVMEFRTLTKDYWDIDNHSTDNLLLISKELGSYVAEVFGWEDVA